MGDGVMERRVSIAWGDLKPGDTVYIAANGKMFLNGKPIDVEFARASADKSWRKRYDAKQKSEREPIRLVGSDDNSKSAGSRSELQSSRVKHG